MPSSSSVFSQREATFLAQVQTYCQQTVAPVAAEMDRSPPALQKALEEMGKSQWLAVQVPVSWGGLGLSKETFSRFQMLMARYSGALAFVQTQHQSAARLLAGSEQQALKQLYLPQLATGKKLMGVGFSHLRRAKEPLLKALPVTGGYELSGKVPWVTGWGIFEEWIVGASLPSGEAVYGIVPLKSCQQPAGGRLQVGQPMPLAVMEATNTVKVNLENWFLESERVVAVQPKGAFAQQDQQNVLQAGFLALGCAWAALDVLETAYQQKALPFLGEALTVLASELKGLQEKMLGETRLESASQGEKLQWRCQAIALAGRSAQVAVAAGSGESNHLSHPAQRVYREALMFTVSGQTTAVMEATIKQLLFPDLLGSCPNPEESAQA